MDAPPLALDLSSVPPPDPSAAASAFVVVVDAVERIAFHDWGGPSTAGPPIILIHGLSGTSWTWAPVARRLSSVRRVVAMDLRGHGISDAPTHGYDPDTLAEDVVAVADGSGLTGQGRLVVAGHGFGAIVARAGKLVVTVTLPTSDSAADQLTSVTALVLSRAAALA